MKNQTKGILLATTTAILWGMLAIALKVGLNYFDSYTIVWSRFFIAALCLIIYYAFKKPSYLKVYRKPPWLMVLAAIFLGGNYIGYMQGVNYAGPAVTQIVIQIGPILLGLIGFVLFKEKITWVRAIGFVVAGIGFVIFYASQISEFAADREDFIIGVLWILFAAVSWTSYAVANKKLVQKWPPQQVNLIVFALPALIFMPTADFSIFLNEYEWWVWVLLLALGLNTVVAYGTLAASFKYAEANRISIVITMNPIITFIILEVLLLFEAEWFQIKPVPLIAYMGAALVILGAIIAVGLKKKR